MATYTLTIQTDQASVMQFNKQGWRLCFASGIASDSAETCNVVAYTTTVEEKVTINWSAKYAMAASKSPFHNDLTFTAATQQADINLGQSYTLPAKWTSGTVQNDPTAPKAGFKFVNQANHAAAVVYKKVCGSYVPIYISKNAPLPSGVESLTPIEKVRVWFSSSDQTSTMISKFDGTHCDIDFTGATTKSVQYNGGVWTGLPSS